MYQLYLSIRYFYVYLRLVCYAASMLQGRVTTRPSRSRARAARLEQEAARAYLTWLLDDIVYADAWTPDVFDLKRVREGLSIPLTRLPLDLSLARPLRKRLKAAQPWLRALFANLVDGKRVTYKFHGLRIETRRRGDSLRTIFVVGDGELGLTDGLVLMVLMLLDWLPMSLIRRCSVPQCERVFVGTKSQSRCAEHLRRRAPALKRKHD